MNILICGLNGSGKTTLGKTLADELGFFFLNDEDYYFLESEIPYTVSRSEEEAKAFILSKLKQYDSTVIVSVKGNLGADIVKRLDVVVYLSAPLDERLSRIKKREIEKYGNRVLEGGDMYKQQKAFHDFCASRTPEKILNFLETLSCKVIKIDGTKPISENISHIKMQL